jgi:hypothetical protein
MSNDKKVPPKAEKVIVHRSAVDGRFVTETYANKHKATTEREVRKITSDRSRNTGR